MFGIGGGEWILILVIALLIFGPRKLPEIGRTLGKAMYEFRKASNSMKNTLEADVAEADRQASQAADVQAQTGQDTPSGPSVTG